MDATFLDEAKYEKAGVLKKMYSSFIFIFFECSLRSMEEVYYAGSGFLKLKILCIWITLLTWAPLEKLAQKV